MQARLAQLAGDKRTPVWLLAAATVVAVPLLVYWQRDSGIWQDEWTFLLYRTGWGLDDILGSFNGHMLPLTAIVFNLDRELFSPGATAPPTALSIAAQIALVWATFAYLRTRLGEWIAAAGALSLMFWGTGYELLVWNFNFGWMIALAAGVGALVLYDREDSTRNRIGVAALLVLSLAGDNNGLVFIGAILLQALYKQTRRRAIAVTALPLTIFLAWYLVEGRDDRTFYFKSWPSWIASVIESTFSGLPGSIGGPNAWGAPLAVLTIAVMLWLLGRRTEIEPRLASALALPLIFIALITLGRGGVFDAAASRYRYTLILLIGLALAELLRGVRLRTIGQWLGFVAVALFFFVGNLSAMADGANSIRGGFDFNRDYLTAMTIAGPVARTSAYDPVDPGLHPEMNADVYDWLAKGGGGDFAMTPAELAAQPPATQRRVQKYASALRENQPPDDSR